MKGEIVLEINNLKYDYIYNYEKKILELLIDSYLINFDLTIEESIKISNEKLSSIKEYIKEEKATLLIAIDERELKGIIWLHKHQVFEESRMHVNQIIIDYKYRGKGIAKKLINEAEKLALKEGLKAIDLFVTESNVRALEMYKNLGFETERRYLKKKL